MNSANVKRGFDLSVILFVSAAYCANRFWLKRIVDIPAISCILRCYFNDFLAGIGVISYLNLLFSLSKYKHIKVDSNGVAIAICFACGLAWEYIFPLFYSHGTSDIWDIVSYMLGGITYIGLLNENNGR